MHDLQTANKENPLKEILSSNQEGIKFDFLKKHLLGEDGGEEKTTTKRKRKQLNNKKKKKSIGVDAVMDLSLFFTKMDPWTKSPTLIQKVLL